MFSQLQRNGFSRTAVTNASDVCKRKQNSQPHKQHAHSLSKPEIQNYDNQHIFWAFVSEFGVMFWTQT